MKKATIYQVIIGLLLVGLLISAVVIFLAYQRPLDTPLEVVVDETDTQQPTQVSTSTQVVQATTSVPEATATLEETEEAEAVCGMTGAMNILIVASDNNWWVTPAGADAVRLARVDFDKQEILVYALPRDLLVDTPSYEDYGFDRIRLGPLYYKILQAEKPDKDASYKAVNAVAQTIYDNFGVKADYYIDIRGTEDLSEIIDDIGKIEIDVAKTFEDEDLGVGLSSGVHKIDGETAILYMRPLEEPDEEWNRITRQNEVLKGLVQKLADPEILDDIPALYAKYNDTVATDLSVEQIVGLACLADKVDFENIQLKSVSKNMVTVESQGVMLVDDPNALKNEIQGYFSN